MHEHNEAMATAAHAAVSERTNTMSFLIGADQRCTMNVLRAEWLQ
ncbi:hypothetical protein DB32_002734 [Sandaracinus amylolyticus]|uniref:Uncharacterized protein n=1 Tax=Sandaracinus amylolyticus TaxID=927083 RepID=A0A0F6YHF1_9BACT|nr:hypothetical protein DB32_002734 [Sandaracinus amylolyticus]